MKPEVVGFGHILYDMRCYVDRFPKPDKTSFIRGRIKGSVGGSATNVICNLAKLGRKPALLGKIGFDSHGEAIMKYFRSLGVDSSGVRIDSRAPTGLSIVVVDQKGQPAVVEMLGANDRFLPKDIDFSPIDSAKLVHLTGAPLRSLELVSARAKAARAVVTFDPGRSISRLGCRKLGRVLANTDLLIINRKEAAELGGLARLAKTLPTKTIVVKGGSKPTVIYDPLDSAFVEVGVIPIKVKDTIGSGDAFSAGLIARLLEGNSVWEAVAYGNACGALKATREGADGLPHRKEVDRFYMRNRGKILVRCLRRTKFR